MESSKKNMIILKNLPSNLIEEAIVILKENKNMKKYQYIEERHKRENKEQVKSMQRKNSSVKNVKEKDKKVSQTVNKAENDYIVREAEMIINNYISELENKSPKCKNNIKNLEKKYKKSLKLNLFLGFIAILSFLVSMI